MTDETDVLEAVKEAGKQNKPAEAIDILARAIWGDIINEFGNPPIVPPGAEPTMTDEAIADLKKNEGGIAGLVTHGLVRYRLAMYAHAAGAEKLARLFYEQSERLRQAAEAN